MIHRRSSSVLKYFKVGEVIFTEGEPGNWAYIIEAGKVEITVEIGGKPVPLQVLTPGDILGETAFVKQAPRTASARAIEDTVCLAISSAQLSERLQASDPVIQLLITTMLHRIQTLSQATVSFYQNSLQASAPLPPAAAISHETHGVLDKIRLEAELRTALTQRQLQSYYQPLVDIDTQAILGFEALIRWHSPTRGSVPSAQFTSLAEETSLIIPIGTWALEQACRDLARLQTGYHQRRLFMSINVAPKQLAKNSFIEHLLRITQAWGLTSEQIKLEVTERVFLEDPVALDMLKRCRSDGFHISLDDFGTGFSSLSYLTQFEVDSFKIDRTCVKEIMTNPRTQVLLEAMLHMAHGLGIPTLVEGIETVEQLVVLQQLGCDIGQGYLFGHPLPFEEAYQLLHS